jgi:hypothetical protein
MMVKGEKEGYFRDASPTSCVIIDTASTPKKITTASGCNKNSSPAKPKAIGAIPTSVVKVVIKIGLNLVLTPVTNAGKKGSSSLRLL